MNAPIGRNEKPKETRSTSVPLSSTSSLSSDPSLSLRTTLASASSSGISKYEKISFGIGFGAKVSVGISGLSFEIEEKEGREEKTENNENFGKIQRSCFEKNRSSRSCSIMSEG